MITRAHISASDIIVKADAGKKNSLPPLVKDQIVQARVLQSLPNGRVQLLLNGRRITAKTGLLLAPGEEVQLKVQAQKDIVILKLMDPVQKVTTRQISSLINMFSKNGSASDITGSKSLNVKTLLYEMALKSDKADNNFLPKLIEKSGIIWEKKMSQVLLGKANSTNVKMDLNSLLEQDIKGNILKEMTDATIRKTGAFEKLSSFSKLVENFQLANQSSSESGRFLLPFPIFSESAFSYGQLFIDTGGKTKKDDKVSDKVIQISFLLNMTHLGPLRADFSILKKDITGRFLLRDKDTCEYVESMIPELKTGLAMIEYHVRQIECGIAEKEDIHQGNFVETLMKARGDQVLNVVI